jgi:alpha-beta hydrolase superfamily lysophospholipase
VLVHGRAARLNECFRLLETMVDRGIPSLCPSYRNDADAPADPGGLYRQGAQEWRDIEAAVAEAVARGASDIVLVGYSMGGQISANFLRRSPLAERVRAVVWDAPLLDWGPVLELAASDRGVPTAVVPLGMFASQLRAGIDYDDLDQVANADEFDTPILLIHGTDDDTVPLSVADRFAQARPDLVTYLRVEGAGHVHAWNVDPPVYEQAVDDFLDEVLGAG